MTSGMLTPARFNARLVIPLARLTYFLRNLSEIAVHDEAAMPWDKKDRIRIAITPASYVVKFTSTMLEARKVPIISGSLQALGERYDLAPCGAV
jgi:hypothetical protein